MNSSTNKKSKIWLSPPHMCGKEQQFIDVAFKENYIAPLGSNISGFENDLEQYLKQNRFVTALNSGTAAIHLALILLKIGKKDEVICQSNTYIASVNPVMYQYATPIFVDSEEETWNMSPKLLEIAIKDRISKNRKPKAIITVHIYGMPYKVDAIHSIAKKYNIPVIEDSAEALGSSYKNQKCGTFGDLSILSFNGNKIITTSGGGALITKNKSLKEKAIYFSTQAKDESISYLHSKIGYNYRMSNVSAGIGRGQMLTLDNHIIRRRQVFEFYKDNLKKLDAITFLKEPKHHFSNRWLTCILTGSNKKREQLRTIFDKENIETRPLWKPMHQQPVFKDAPKYLNGFSDKLHEKGLCLPSGSNLSEADLDRIIACFTKLYG